MSASPAQASRGAQIMREFVPSSPLVGHLGMWLEAIEPEKARLVLPFDPSLATVGDVIHGGAICALADTAAMAAAWSTDDVPDALRGTTVGLSVSFLSAARGCDLVATARVVKRGRSLCFCEVVVAPAEGEPVAQALVTYKLG